MYFKLVSLFSSLAMILRAWAIFLIILNLNFLVSTLFFGTSSLIQNLMLQTNKEWLDCGLSMEFLHMLTAVF